MGRIIDITIPGLITVNSFTVKGFTHFLTKPVSIVPIVEDGVVSAIYEPLGIDVYAESVDQLEDAIREDLAWKWTNFVNANANMLAPDALFVRNALIESVSVPDALLG